ncbi:glutathione S-transferase Mu 1-like [Tropilaelaps mercedesae]|uniref:glutathione transferase n=1 Tax=Tropilaelaps mercedesae TaxID=418985 RepID=A0A1V9XEB4_9ACAR|nr:glutathione S-transferase Mu 1-like [Tropilaelaps mercedesae]
MFSPNAEKTHHADEDAILFGYWDIRGLGQAIRHVLEYTGLQYDEHRYSFGEKFDGREHWLREKFTLGLDFPNLPYIKTGDVKLTQSFAILRFLARRTGLFPETEEGQQRVDLAEQQVNDIIWHCVRVCYNKNYNNHLKEEYIGQFLGTRCREFNDFLDERNFVAGDQLTYVDFIVWEMFDQHRTLWPEYEKMYAPFLRLGAYLQRIEALPKFARYIQSDNEMSSYGGPKMPAPKPLVG